MRLTGPITRRTFLHQGASAVLGLSLQPLLPQILLTGLPRVDRSKKVVVLGAGLAGLSAGYELINARHEVVILEARMRPGGRVFTLRAPFSDGLHAEAGAARICPGHDWTLKYTKLFGLTLDPFYPSDLADVAFIAGERMKLKPREEVDLMHVPVDLTPQERNLGFTGLWDRYTGQVLKDLGDVRSPTWPSRSLEKYDRLSFAELLRAQGASAGAAVLMDLPYQRPEEDDYSALWMLRDLVLDVQCHNLYKIRGGSDLLPQAFASRLRDNIRYGAVVTRIEQDDRTARAIYKQNDRTEQVSGDRMICTIPFSVLRHIDVSPPFSEGKRRAIEQLNYDSVCRVYAQTRSRAWREGGFNGFGITDFPEELWDPTFDQPGPRGILVTYMTDGNARRTSAQREAERLTTFLDRMEKIFPGVGGHCEGGLPGRGMKSRTVVVHSLVPRKGR